MLSFQNKLDITVRHFTGFMKYFKPGLKPDLIEVNFRYLNKSNSGYLSLEEFYDIYDVAGYDWKVGD